MNAQPDISPFLDKRPFVGSYTILSTDENCPHQMAHRYIWKTLPYVETPEMKWGNDVHSAFEYRIGGGKPLPVNMQQWECFAAPFDGQNPLVEQKLGISAEGRACGFFSDKPQVFFRGKADCVIIKGETAYIADWKTGGSKYEDPFELETNAMLLHAKFPQLKKIMGSYVWLKENRLSQMYDLSDTARTWATVCTKIAAILERKARNEFEKKPSGLCKGWCSVETCEHWRPKAVK